MLFIPTEMLEQFLTFCGMMYGTKIHKHASPVGGEYARFMIGESIVLVRDHVDESIEPLTLEVFCSDEKKLDILTRAWAGAINDEEKETSDE